MLVVDAELPEKPGASTGSTAGWRPRPIQAGNELRKAGVPCTAGGGGTLRAPPALCASIQKNTLNSHQGRSGTQKAYRQKRWHEMTGFTGKLRKRLVQWSHGIGPRGRLLEWSGRTTGAGLTVPVAHELLRIPHAMAPVDAALPVTVWPATGDVAGATRFWISLSAYATLFFFALFCKPDPPIDTGDCPAQQLAGHREISTARRRHESGENSDGGGCRPIWSRRASSTGRTSLHILHEGMD